MKDYHEVVEERFNKEPDPVNSIYSPAHPIGRHIRYVLYRELRKFTEWFTKQKGPLKDKQLLDLGCGEGGMIHFFTDLGFAPENCTGVDFSAARIKRATQGNSTIRFVHGDALTIDLQKKFDVITSFDLFSHFPQNEQLLAGLRNANNHLAEDGVFLWYDICSPDHFNSPKNAESWGFSHEQMINLAQNSGFELISSRKLFKFFFNRYQSVYQASRLPVWLLRALEKIVPGRPGNLLLVFKKAK
jgi:SAM-dependent methyltransferase